MITNGTNGRGRSWTEMDLVEKKYVLYLDKCPSRWTLVDRPGPACFVLKTGAGTSRRSPPRRPYRRAARPADGGPEAPGRSHSDTASGSTARPTTPPSSVAGV